MESQVSRKYLRIYDGRIVPPANVSFPAEVTSSTGSRRFTQSTLENCSLALAKAVLALA